MKIATRSARAKEISEIGLLNAFNYREAVTYAPLTFTSMPKCRLVITERCKKQDAKVKFKTSLLLEASSCIFQRV